MTLKIDAKFTETLICCFKIDKNLVKSNPNTQKYQKCVPVVQITGLKKYRGVIFHDTEEWCKIWKTTDLWFGKWHEEYGKFSPEHLKLQNWYFHGIP